MTLDLEVQKLVVDGKVKCWLDIDINGSRAAYQRAVDFVGAKNLACACASRPCAPCGLPSNPTHLRVRRQPHQQLAPRARRLGASAAEGDVVPQRL